MQRQVHARISEELFGDIPNITTTLHKKGTRYHVGDKTYGSQQTNGDCWVYTRGAVRVRVDFRGYGSLCTEQWRKNGIIHRDGDLPAYVMRGSDILGRESIIEREGYYINGFLHREGGPAIIERTPRGAITLIAYYRRGVLSRDDGPALVRQCGNGDVYLVEYRVNDQLHRMDGPARVENDAEEWWQNGRMMTPQEIEKIMRPDDIMAAIWTLPQPIAEEVAAEYRAV